MSRTETVRTRLGSAGGRATVVVMAVSASGALAPYFTGALSPFIRADLSAPLWLIGVFVALFFIGASVGALATGRYADRFAPVSQVRLAAAIMAVALLGAGLSTAHWSFGAGLLLTGMGHGIGQTSANALIHDHVRSGRHGLAFGLKQSSIPMAVFVSGFAVALAAGAGTWRAAFLGAAAANALVAAGARRFLAGSRRTDHGAPARSVPPMDPATRATLLILATSALLGTAMANGFSAYYVETAVHSGLAIEHAALTVSIAGGLGVVSRIVVGAVSDRWVAPYLVLVGALMALGGVAALLMLSGRMVLVIVAGVVAYGLGWAWPGLLVHAVAADHPDAPGRSTAYIQGGISAGAAVGPLVFGLVLGSHGISWAWLATGAIAVLAAFLMAVGRARRRRTSIHASA